MSNYIIAASEEHPPEDKEKASEILWKSWGTNLSAVVNY